MVDRRIGKTGGGIFGGLGEASSAERQMANAYKDGNDAAHQTAKDGKRWVQQPRFAHRHFIVSPPPTPNFSIKHLLLEPF